MGTNRLRSWRVGATSVTLWALLVTATSLEVYDELPEVDSPSYQDENFLDTGPKEKQQESPDLALAKDVLLYRLIQSIQKDSQRKSKFKSDWLTKYQHPHRPVRASEDFSKEAMVKRLTNALTGNERNLGYRSLDQYRPQQKWKIKKGKSLGNQMVCYFKLCAFRSSI